MILVIVQRREGGFGDRPKRSFLMIVHVVNSILIVHVAKVVSTINHVLMRMMTTGNRVDYKPRREGFW